MKLQNALVALVSFLLSPSSWSAPIHGHCLVVPWSIESRMFSETGVHLVAPNTVPSLFGLLPLQPSILSTDLCRYEISDITRIDITLTFTNTGLEANSSGVVVGVEPNLPSIFSALPLQPGGGATDNSPLPFVSGLSRTFPFVPHTNSDSGFIGGDPPTHLGLPNGFTFPVSFLDLIFHGHLTSTDGQPIAITDGRAVVHGNHYYLAIPEPPTFALSLSALLVTISSRRKRISGVGAKSGPRHSSAIPADTKPTSIIAGTRSHSTACARTL